MNPLEDDLRRGLRALTDDPPPMNGLREPVVRRARTARIRTTMALTIAGAALVATAALAWPTPDASPLPIAGGPATGTPATGADPSSGNGPSSGIPSGIGDPNPGAGPGVVAGTAYPHRLYVHCGIRYAKFDGRWWQAVHPGEAPSAPAGEDGNYLAGTMTLKDADRATFTGDQPAVRVDFAPYPGEPAPCD